MAHDPIPNPQDAELVKNLPKRLFNPRDDMLRVSRQLARDIELLKKTMDELSERVRRLEEKQESPP